MAWSRVVWGGRVSWGLNWLHTGRRRCEEGGGGERCGGSHARCAQPLSVHPAPHLLRLSRKKHEMLSACSGSALYWVNIRHTCVCVCEYISSHAITQPACIGCVPQALRSCADEGSATAAVADAREKGLRSRLLPLQQQLEEQDAEVERLQVSSRSRGRASNLVISVAISVSVGGC